MEQEKKRRQVMITQGLNKGTIGCFLGTEDDNGELWAIVEMDYTYSVRFPIDSIYFMDGKGVDSEN